MSNLTIRLRSSLNSEGFPTDLESEAADEIERLEAENERLEELLRLPYPPNDGKTHWEGCWKDRGHHNCAVKEIERLQARVEALEACKKYARHNSDCFYHLECSCGLNQALAAATEQESET